MARLDKNTMDEVVVYLSHQPKSRPELQSLSLGALAVLSSGTVEEPKTYQEDVTQRTGALGTGGGVAASEMDVGRAMAGVLAAAAAATAV
jgi:hypothetical protein